MFLCFIFTVNLVFNWCYIAANVYNNYLRGNTYSRSSVSAYIFSAGYLFQPFVCTLRTSSLKTCTETKWKSSTWKAVSTRSMVLPLRSSNSKTDANLWKCVQIIDTVLRFKVLSLKLHISNGRPYFLWCGINVCRSVQQISHITGQAWVRDQHGGF